MPLQKSSSDKAFKSNLKEMIKAGHPMKQALAAAYATKRHSMKKKAKGGMAGYEAGGQVDATAQAVAKLEAERMKMKQQAVNKNAKTRTYDPNDASDVEKRESERQKEDEKMHSGMNAGGEVVDPPLPAAAHGSSGALERLNAIRAKMGKTALSDEEWQDAVSYARGGHVDTVNEKLHPMHELSHQRSLVASIMKKRMDPKYSEDHLASEIGEAAYAHGGDVEDEDNTQDAFVVDNADLEPAESENERVSRRHEALRKLARKQLSY